MAIKGSLKEASLPDVLQLLAMGKKTGCLGLAVHDSFGSIYFDTGRICHAEIANRPLDTENAVYNLFTWTSGSFNFEPGVLPKAGTTLASVDPQSLLLEGARRVDEWTLIEKKIPSFDMVFALDRQRLLVNKLPLTPEQEILIPLIDGNRDVNALVRDSQIGEFDVGKAIYGLITASFVLPVGRAMKPDSAPRDASPEERRNLGVALYRAGMYDEADRELKNISAAGRTDPLALFHIGLIALRRGDWQGAVDAFQAAAPVASQKSALLHNLALAYERLGQLEKARLLAERAVAASRKPDPMMQLQVGVIAIRAGDLKAAKIALSEARSLWTSSSPPAIWFHYAALVSAMSGDPRREILLLGAGTETYRDAPVLLNNLAAACIDEGDFQHAREAAERGLSLAPELPQLHRNLADAMIGIGAES
jgi:tetratricopeptide (TPR) repeat protein